MKNKLQQYIKNIKTFFISKLAVILKGEKQFDSKYDNWFVRMRYDDSEQLEKERKILKERTMTYIVSGKLNNCPFLMIDCVATTITINLLTTKKKLITTEEDTYFCHTGIDAYQFAVDCFDEKCYINNEKFDFKNINHINEILEIFKLLIIRPEYNQIGIKINNDCRLYFINKNGVYYYNVDSDGDLYDLVEVPNNTYIKPDNYLVTPIEIKIKIENNDELITFCKNKILNAQNYGIDIKDRLSYIIFNENQQLINNSIKNNKELVLSMVGADYNELK